ncbi:MAG: small subunit ribosomal protein S7 [Parcubacteria group bacterium Licking1014_17]|nr:MAG: small subunit ribosomal protein S7 [Parcubacteria group bacterium Licking1014_17]
MRKKIKHKIITKPDLRFASPIVAKLINMVMQAGKKSIAQKIVYDALEKAEKAVGKPVLEVMALAIENAGPQLELKSRRIGGANYQVPYEVRAERKILLALRWIIESARNGKGKPMAELLAKEIIDAVNNTGTAVKKKMDMHRMAEANKAFAHFAW